MGVSKNRDTPKSSILIGFSIINHPFWGTPILGNTYIGNHFKNYGSFSQNPPFQVSSETSPPGLLGYLRCPTTKTYRLRWLFVDTRFVTSKGKPKKNPEIKQSLPNLQIRQHQQKNLENLEKCQESPLEWSTKKKGVTSLDEENSQWLMFGYQMWVLFHMTEALTNMGQGSIQELNSAKSCFFPIKQKMLLYCRCQTKTCWNITPTSTGGPLPQNTKTNNFPWTNISHHGEKKTSSKVPWDRYMLVPSKVTFHPPFFWWSNQLSGPGDDGPNCDHQVTTAKATSNGHHCDQKLGCSAKAFSGCFWRSWEGGSEPEPNPSSSLVEVSQQR